MSPTRKETGAQAIAVIAVVLALIILALSLVDLFVPTREGILAYSRVRVPPLAADRG